MPIVFPRKISWPTKLVRTGDATKLEIEVAMLIVSIQSQILAGKDLHKAVIECATQSELDLESVKLDSLQKGDLVRALLLDAKRLQQPLLSDLAEVLKIIEVSGGRVHEALEHIGLNHRVEVELKRLVSSELAAARATAKVLLGLPFLGLVMVSLVDAKTIIWLLTSGKGVLLAGVGFEMLGLLWLKRIMLNAVRHKSTSEITDFVQSLLLLLRAGYSQPKALQYLLNDSSELRPELAQVFGQVTNGQSWLIAGQQLIKDDFRWRYVIGLLDLSIRSGAPIVPGLQNLLTELYEQEKAERLLSIRSVAVRSTLPLGLCLLPAFIILTVVPVVYVFAMSTLG